MNSGTFQARVLEVVGEVLDAPSERWPDIVPAACGNDADLIAEVWRLLHGQHAAEGFLETPLLRLPPLDAPSPGLLPGTLVGPYSVLRLIASGGMGDVYEAAQAQPSRSVALKVIRSGAMSRQMLRRFEHESRVLGRLQHPGIAQIFEAGVCEPKHPDDGPDGCRAAPLPYFAMEFIRGEPLTAYAAQRRLDTRGRLELIARVCDAVAHAHQKGVIHRDLKPGNVLVDASGQPKILDFGIARATDSDVQRTTRTADLGQIIGTLPYMSPEQISDDHDSLDTRTDVYALGVIAFEILTGRLPLEVARRTIQEAIRIVREESPLRLSAVDRVLRGDVETIVSKALEKDKSRRYPSAEALASDIRRYLNHETIAARPASTWYQVRTFSRRHRGLVGGVAAALVVLIGGIVATGVALHHANEQTAVARRETERALAAEAEQARLRERASADRDAVENSRKQAETILGFVTRSLKAGDPQEGGSQEATIAQAMENAIKALDAGEFRDDAETEAHLRSVIAGILQDNGHPERAEPLLRQALETSRRLHTGDHSNVAAALNNLGDVCRELGRATEAAALFQDALDMNRRLYGGDHPELALSLNNLASVKEQLGRATDAEPLYQQSLEMYQRLYEGDHHEIATGMNNLALVRHAMGRAAEAEPLYRQVVAMNERLHHGDHPDVAWGLNNLAFVLRDLGRPAEAEPLFVRALEMRKRLFKGDHPDVAQSLNNLGLLYETTGRSAEAEPLFLEALDIRRRVFSGDHPDVAVSLSNLGRVRLSLGRAADAETLYVQSLNMRIRVFGSEHPAVATGLVSLARCLAALDRLPEALIRSQEAADMVAHLLPQDHPTRKLCDTTLAEMRRKAESNDNRTPAATFLRPGG